MLGKCGMSDLREWMCMKYMYVVSCSCVHGSMFVKTFAAISYKPRLLSLGLWLDSFATPSIDKNGHFVLFAFKLEDLGLAIVP